MQQGDFNALPILTEDEREALLYAAWHIDERPHHTPQSDINGFKMYEPSGDGNRFEQRPGDDFIMRGDMRSILIKHGWTPLGVQPDPAGNDPGPAFPEGTGDPVHEPARIFQLCVLPRMRGSA